MDEQQTDRTYLYRLATLFMSLATLADSASHRSPKIRFLVLCILRPAARYASLWLRREVERLGFEPPDLPPLLKGHAPAAARRLAAHFCAVAQILQALGRLESPPPAYSVGWTLYGLLAPVLSVLAPVVASEQPRPRGLGFR
ncbi:hypothetical protein BO068_004979, partial [Escherichia coli]|nr:hypothetical protein [Escherichia coli]